MNRVAQYKTEQHSGKIQYSINEHNSLTQHSTARYSRRALNSIYVQCAHQYDSAQHCTIQQEETTAKYATTQNDTLLRHSIGQQVCTVCSIFVE